MGRHTDYGCLTVLRLEDGTEGLEVEDRETGEMVPVPPLPGTWVINGATRRDATSHQSIQSAADRLRDRSVAD